VELEEALALKLLQAVADNRAGCGGVAGGACSTAVASSIPVAEGSDSDAWAKVHTANNGCSTDVEPVLTVWSKLLEVAGLHQVSPLWDLEFWLTLEEVSALLDEVSSWDIFNSNTTTSSHLQHRNGSDERTERRWDAATEEA